LSGYMNHRDANQGSCTNACRWKYDAHEAKETAGGDYVPVGVDEFNPEHFAGGNMQVEEPTLGEGAPSEKVFLLQEMNRPNDYMPTFEDQHGTYIMNSKDLRAIQHVEALIKMGVHSLKIEGRTKSHYYTARTAQAYRQAIDDAIAGRPFDMNLMDVLENMSNRGFTEGFFRRHVHDEYQNYERGTSISTKQQFVAEVEADNGDSLVLNVKNRFQVNDSVELMTPEGNLSFKLTEIKDMKGKTRDDAPGSGFVVQIPKPAKAQGVDLSRAMLIRNLPENLAVNVG
ncbi:MAG: U32 family peptidase C-terminal domain-containing protein, partial [Venatoribacter sp.]